MGMIFKVPAYIVMIVGGMWGLFICMAIVIDALGFVGGLIAFFFAPVTIAFAPWYAAIADNNWFPMVLVYGSGIGGTLLHMLGAMVDGD